MSATDPCVKAINLANKGNTKSALSNLSRCIRKTRSLLKKTKISENYVALQKQLIRAYKLEGQLYLSINNISQAKKSFNQAKTIINVIRSSENEIKFLQAQIDYPLAIIHLSNFQNDEGQSLLRSSASLFTEIKNYQQAVGVLFRLLNVYFTIKDKESINQILGELDTIHKKIKDKKIKKEISAKLNFTRGLFIVHYLQDIPKAKSRFQKAIKEYSKIKNFEGVIDALIELSEIEDQIDTAEELLLNALDLAKLNNLKKPQGIIFSKLGAISLKKGDFQNGQERLLKGLKLKTEVGDNIGTGKTILELARMSMLTSSNERDFSKSLELANQSLQLFDAESYDYGRAQALEIISTINTKLNNLDVSKQQIIESRKIFKKSKDINGEARALTQLGIILDQQQRSEEAKPVLEKAYKLYSSTSNKQGLAEVLQLQGSIEEDKTKALDYLQQCKSLYTELIGDNKKLQPILFTLDVKIRELKD